MKTDVKYWSDTGNIDLLVTPESDTEKAVLAYLADRHVTLTAMRTTPIDQLEIVFGKARRPR